MSRSAWENEYAPRSMVGGCERKGLKPKCGGSVRAGVVLGAAISRWWGTGFDFELVFHLFDLFWDAFWDAFFAFAATLVGLADVLTSGVGEGETINLLAYAA
ncbi:hypothetical protein CFE70_009053 [Pyrenophora teres f. teres 0-1]